MSHCVMVAHKILDLGVMVRAHVGQPQGTYMRGITYKQLAESIKRMDKDHIDDTITIYDPARDEFFPITGMETAGEKGLTKNNGEGILDDGCIFLVIPTE